MSNLFNEVKEALTGHQHNNSTKAGPHDTNVANKADPRVDSDMDHRNNPTSIMGSSTSGYGSSTSGTTAGTAGSINVGPHSSNVMNKMDPRVDSDADGSMTVDNPGYGSSMTGNTGYGGSTAGTSGLGSGTTGHHTTGTSGLGCGTIGHHTTGTSGSGCGTTGHHTTGTSGPGCGTTGHHATTTSGTGSATGTSGPHKSDVLNKLDPRVDSDLDGSKTVGANNTY